MPLNPYRIGDWVIYNPSRRGHDLDVMTRPENELVPGEKYRIATIENDDYIVVEGYLHPGGGIYWSDFGPSSPSE